MRQDNELKQYLFISTFQPTKYVNDFWFLGISIFLTPSVAVIHSDTAKIRQGNIFLSFGVLPN